MVEEIEVKRKVFTIVSQIGEHSYKVERKGQFYFLKKFEDDAKAFEQFVDAEHHLRVSGVCNPKCYLFDKKLKIAVIEYIEGDTCLEALLGVAFQNPLLNCSIVHFGMLGMIAWL